MIKEFIQLIYPEFCAGCGDQLQFSEKAVCSSCLVELRNYSFTSAKSFFGRHIAEDEIYLFNNFKNKILQKIVYELKYNRNKSSGYILGMELGYLIKKSIHDCSYDFIVPVPISKVKRNKRGYNQCELIAEGVSQILKVPIAFNYLNRNNNLNSQINSNRYQRWLNVEEQYSLIKEFKNYSKLLIVDDIVTTGATINSCIKAIKKNNTKITISVAALAGSKVI